MAFEEEFHEIPDEDAEKIKTVHDAWITPKNSASDLARPGLRTPSEA